MSYTDEDLRQHRDRRGVSYTLRQVCELLLAARQELAELRRDADSWKLAATGFERERDALRARPAAADVEPRALQAGEEYVCSVDAIIGKWQAWNGPQVGGQRVLRIPVPAAAPEIAPAEKAGWRPRVGDRIRHRRAEVTGEVVQSPSPPTPVGCVCVRWDKRVEQYVELADLAPAPPPEPVGDMLRRHGLAEPPDETKRERLDRETGKRVAPEPPAEGAGETPATWGALLGRIERLERRLAQHLDDQGETL